MAPSMTYPGTATPQCHHEHTMLVGCNRCRNANNVNRTTNADNANGTNTANASVTANANANITANGRMPTMTTLTREKTGRTVPGMYHIPALPRR
jgi:hypothetical protein